MDQDPQQPAWARFQAAKSDAARERQAALLRNLDSKYPSSRPTPLTPAQTAERDRLQGLLDQCRPGLTSDALSWLFAPAPTKPAPEVKPIPGGYTAWFDKVERGALEKVLPRSRRANGTNHVELLDYMLAAAAQAQPLSRVGGDARAAQFRRAASRGVWDTLLSAILAGELDDRLSESRRKAVTRVAKNGVKAREQEQARAKQRQTATDGLAKSRSKSP